MKDKKIIRGMILGWESLKEEIKVKYHEVKT